MVSLRMDHRLRGRLDPSDVIQDTFIEVHERHDEWRARGDMPFFTWVRFLAGQKLAQQHRRHLGTEARDAGREVSPAALAGPEVSSIALAAAFAGRGPTPSGIAMRAEQESAVLSALEEMRPIDREVLALRHFEGMTNQEVAATLGLQTNAASRRYLRALARLQDRVQLGREGN